jgi:hypothetical protein
MTMAIVVTSKSETLDESSGLHNTGAQAATESNNDNAAAFTTFRSSIACRPCDPTASGGMALFTSALLVWQVAIGTAA